MSAANVGITVSSEDLPAVCRASDAASLAARRQYSAVMAANLALLVVAAILGAVALTSVEGRASLAIAGAVVISVVIVLTVVIHRLHFEQAWYDGRAISESAKSLAWRYMTCCEPYPCGLDPAEVDRRFAADVKEVLETRRSFSYSLGGSLAASPQITETMRRARQMGAQDRADLYLTARIDDQISWYSAKAKASQKSSNTFFVLMIGLLVVALAATVVMVRWPNSPFNPNGPLVTLATAFWTWMERARHRELAQSYGLAAQELGLIRDQAPYIREEPQLSWFVSDSENAISREHTLWLARRDHRLPRMPQHGAEQETK